MLLNEPIDDSTIENTRTGYPSLSIKALLSTVRLDASKGKELLTEKIIQAMDTVNKQLIEKHFIVPPLSVDQARFYCRAVYHEAAAIIAEDNLDFDTTSTGQIRGENGLTKTESLRRVVNHCIADLTGRKRNRAKLV